MYRYVRFFWIYPRALLEIYPCQYFHKRLTKTKRIVLGLNTNYIGGPQALLLSSRLFFCCSLWNQHEERLTQKTVSAFFFLFSRPLLSHENQLTWFPGTGNIKMRFYYRRTLSLRSKPGFKPRKSGLYVTGGDSLSGRVTFSSGSDDSSLCLFSQCWSSCSSLLIFLPLFIALFGNFFPTLSSSNL